MGEQLTVHEIDLTKKYVLQYQVPLTQSEMARLRSQIEQWLESDQPFLMLSGDVKLVKLERDDE